MPSPNPFSRVRSVPGRAPRFNIRQLLSYRLHAVAGMLSRTAAMRYKREFAVTLWEWRAVGLLGVESAMSLNELAKAAGLDKSQLSRVVSRLIARGFARRRGDLRDGRVIRLSLTEAGIALYERLIGAAVEREEAFRACLTLEERQVLDSALTKLASKSRELLLVEQQHLDRGSPSHACSPQSLPRSPCGLQGPSGAHEARVRALGEPRL